MDDRSLRTLLSKAERELGGSGREAARVWVVAALITSAVVAYLGILLTRARSLVPGPRALGVAFDGIFGVLAAYCWIRALRARSDRPRSSR